MTGARPLVVAADETVLDEILRVAAVAGCELDRAPDLTAASTHWARAPLVLLDEDAARMPPALPRRGGIFLVCKGSPGPSTWEHAFRVGVERVISLPDEETELAGAFADVVETPAEQPGLVLGVVGGRGGGGASVFASALAMVADRGPGGALLVDCDPLGGGLDVLLSLENTPGNRWPEVNLSGRASVSLLAASLPRLRHRGGSLPVLACAPEGEGPKVESLSAILSAARRSGRTVVCDLPRTLGEVAEEVLLRADLVLLVVPLEFRACLAAKQVLKRLTQLTTRLGVVTCGRSHEKTARSAALLGPPVMASMPPERGLGKAVEKGEFPARFKGPLTTAATKVLRAAHNEAQAATR
ncbi:helicase/secretion neighborhood CpaE-like protein [Amycolatopsis tolypomycina]|uniref:Helicase/secretion neighborhood CpaE-like protein n=1 Tax=Amycolatopsis tolypomycina TaxID=208445 RepID=A0A1H5DGN4_9PSEU|nr:septum site-determining protein Ssd [Amycolatopsis tolypomycina]SED78024.1 helicase/secretion neighborhood CpaE-like protein [Amycolatopsis tolypomycina]